MQKRSHFSRSQIEVGKQTFYPVSRTPYLDRATTEKLIQLKTHTNCIEMRSLRVYIIRKGLADKTAGILVLSVRGLSLEPTQ